MIKILRDLDLKADGVSIYNRKWQHVHLRQGDMDGACAVYSVMMNLLILKVLTRNQVTDLRTTFKGTTSKGRLYKEFFKVEGLCRDGFFFADINEKLSRSFRKEVSSVPQEYAATQSEQALYLEELRSAIDSELSLMTAISFKGGAHAVLAIGYEEKAGFITKVFCLDPGDPISKTALWNAVIMIDEGKGKYCHLYHTESDEYGVYVDESLKITRR